MVHQVGVLRSRTGCTKARAESAYTVADYRRLREVKRAYDPDTFFHLNHNITPA